MATPYLGRAAIGLATESAYGTAAARTNWLRPISVGLRRNRQKVRRPHLLSPGETSANPRSYYVISDDAGGPIVLPMGYSDSTMLVLAHLLGAPTDGGSDNAYTHTYTLKRALPVGLTIEQIQAQKPDATTMAEVFEGCKLTRGTITIPNQGQLTIALDVIAETSGGRTTGGSPTYTANDHPMLARHGSNVAFASLDDKFISATIVIDNHLTTRRFPGSLHTAEPQRGDLQEVLITVVRELDESSVHADYLDDTQGDLTISFDDGTRSMDLTIHNALCEDVETGTGDHGIQTETLRFRGLSDGTDQGFSLVITNDVELYTGN